MFIFCQPIMDRLVCRQKAQSCTILACRETRVSFVNQGYLVKGAKLRSLCTRLYFATKDGVGFSGQLLCLTKRNPRNRRSGGAGLPLYLLHPLTLDPPVPKKGFLISQLTALVLWHLWSRDPQLQRAYLKCIIPSPQFKCEVVM